MEILSRLKVKLSWVFSGLCKNTGELTNNDVPKAPIVYNHYESYSTIGTLAYDGISFRPIKRGSHQQLIMINDLWLDKCHNIAYYCYGQPYNIGVVAVIYKYGKKGELMKSSLSFRGSKSLGGDWRFPILWFYTIGSAVKLSFHGTHNTEVISFLSKLANEATKNL